MCFLRLEKTLIVASSFFFFLNEALWRGTDAPFVRGHVFVVACSHSVVMCQLVDSCFFYGGCWTYNRLRSYSKCALWFGAVCVLKWSGGVRVPSKLSSCSTWSIHVCLWEKWQCYWFFPLCSLYPWACRMGGVLSFRCQKLFQQFHFYVTYHC